MEDKAKESIINHNQVKSLHTQSGMPTTKVYLTIYALAFTGAEVVTVLVHPMWGIVFHIVLLMAVIMHSAFAAGLAQQNRQLILSLALIPLVRILSLSMPLMNIPQMGWYPIIYTPLVAAGLVVSRISGYRLADIGFRRGFIPVQLAVALTGIVFGLLEYLILRPQPFVAQFTLQEILPLALIFLAFTGFGEEFIFRGVLQRTAVDAVGTKGIIYISFLFAILHMGFLSWIDLVFVFAVALFFGWIVKKTGSLLGVALAHGITNIMLYLIIPFF